MFKIPELSFKHLHLHLGNLADAFIQSDFNQYICQEKEEQKYITVGTVRIFIET